MRIKLINLLTFLISSQFVVSYFVKPSDIGYDRNESIGEAYHASNNKVPAELKMKDKSAEPNTDDQKKVLTWFSNTSEDEKKQFLSLLKRIKEDKFGTDKNLSTQPKLKSSSSDGFTKIHDENKNESGEKDDKKDFKFGNSNNAIEAVDNPGINIEKYEGSKTGISKQDNLNSDMPNGVENNDGNDHDQGTMYSDRSSSDSSMSSKDTDSNWLQTASNDTVKDKVDEDISKINNDMVENILQKSDADTDDEGDDYELKVTKNETAVDDEWTPEIMPQTVTVGKVQNFETEIEHGVKSLEDKGHNGRTASGNLQHRSAIVEKFKRDVNGGVREAMNEVDQIDATNYNDHSSNIKFIKKNNNKKKIKVEIKVEIPYDQLPYHPRNLSFRSHNGGVVKTTKSITSGKIPDREKLPKALDH